MDTETTDFGYEQVTAEEKSRRVSQVFSSVAHKYDLMNDLMSCGLHRIWKKVAISFCPAQPGQTVLDMAGGTGDLSTILAAKVGDNGAVILADINVQMLSAGRNKLTNAGLLGPVKYLQACAEHIPLATNSVHHICIGFGLRNITNKAQALQEFYRILIPGGRLLILEFSQPDLPFALQKLYDAYSFKLIPKLGELICNDSESYRYLVESIRKHPDQDMLKELLQQQSFVNCRYINMSAGICAVHIGEKI